MNIEKNRTLLIWVSKLFFGIKERKRLWKRLAVQIEYNVNLNVALENYCDRLAQHNSPLELVMRDVIRSNNMGIPFYQAISDYIPSEESMLLRAGITGGHFSDNLLLCTELMTVKEEISQEIKKALRYPLLLLLLIIVMLVGIAWYIIPELTVLSDPTAWTGAAGILYAVSNVIASPMGVMLLAGIGLVFLAVYLSLSRLTGRLRFYLDKAAPYSMYRLTVGAVWLFTLATLMKAGISINFIIQDMLASPVLTRYLRERMEAVSLAYQQGFAFGKTLASTRMDFPSRELIEDIQVYESYPNFYDNLYDLAKEWLKDGKEEILEKAKTLNAICLLMVFSIVGFLALALTSIQSQMRMSLGM